jgi:adenine-specific DNA-methyltransferase
MPTLQFKGKTFVQNHHLTVKYHQLVPNKKLSLTDKISLHDNLIIKGDNLKALKALLPTYAGKIKCIYIDPPYNTGNSTWIYKDNVNSPMIQEWLGKEVDKEDMTRHEKWLCMMTPRLKLLRELLSEDGAIFISIDDNEQHNLRVLLDDIFDSQNFGACICWMKKHNGNNQGVIPPVHDFILCYAKNISQVKFPGFALSQSYLDSSYSNPDNDPRGSWTTMDLSANHKGPYFSIKNPNNNKEYFPPKGRYWVFNEIDVLSRIDDGRIIFGTKGQTAPVQKVFLSERNLRRKAETWWDDKGLNEDGMSELTEIFGESKIFDHPKPSNLLYNIFSFATNPDDIILDSFSGSGTTAHAVLELNKEDGGNRKFILIEQEDYASTITAERVRRVIKGVKTAKSETLKNGIEGTFSYFELGPTIEMESILQGKNLPSYEEFARYIFYTATGEDFNEKKINKKTGFIGETKNYELYMFYKPDVEWLKRNALTLDGVKAMPKFKGKQRLVFAPAKYVDDYTCLENRIDFCQLPYEIYRIQK